MLVDGILGLNVDIHYRAVLQSHHLANSEAGRDFADAGVQSLRELMLLIKAKFSLSVEGFRRDPIVGPRLLVGLFQQRL